MVIRSTAPEVFAGVVSKRCDLWSLGVVAFELLGGKKPFTDSSIASLIKSIGEANLKFDEDMWMKRTFPSKRFCCELLCKVPESRLTAAEVLNHFWITHDDLTETLQPAPLRPSVLLSPSPEMDEIIEKLIFRQNFLSERSQLEKLFKSSDIRALGTVTVLSFKHALKKVVGEPYYSFGLNDIKLDAVSICYTDFLAAAVHEYTLALGETLCGTLDAALNSTSTTRQLALPLVQEIVARDLPEVLSSKILGELSNRNTDDERKISLEAVFRSFDAAIQEISDQQLPEHDTKFESTLVLL